MRWIRAMATALIRYGSDLDRGRVVLWCYLIWYLCTVLRRFDPDPAIWLNSLGLSAVIGTALVLSVHRQGFRDLAFWPTFRLFLMPFCVSSFAALIKDQGFVVILPPSPTETLLNLSLCGLFVVAVWLCEQVVRGATPNI